MVAVDLRHLVSLYFPLKLFFTSGILVLALKMVDASIRMHQIHARRGGGGGDGGSQPIQVGRVMSLKYMQYWALVLPSKLIS